MKGHFESTDLGKGIRMGTNDCETFGLVTGLFFGFVLLDMETECIFLII